MDNKERIELDLSVLDSSTFPIRGVVESFLDDISGEPKVSEDQKITVIGNKTQFEKFYQMLKEIDLLRERNKSGKV